ncbi:RDD family protein [Pseudalkalibacillus sp. SCS-8]|uniref:RDD family protein n=1 Tax=Pseudalkalibacillus nanhaiensis TaxID=3115291 RepID=UPI0032DA6872
MDHIQSEEHQSGFDSPSTNPPKEKVYAGFWMRLWANLIDLLVIGSLYRILIYPTFRWFDLPLSDESIFSLKAILTAVIFYGYFLLMTRFFGQTLGKMVLAIKVVTKDLDDRLNWSTLFFREVIGRFISIKILAIGYLIAAFTSEKRALHDIFADTRVIHTKK